MATDGVGQSGLSEAARRRTASTTRNSWPTPTQGRANSEWRNFVVFLLLPVILSGVTWLISLETRLHEHAERLTHQNRLIDELERRARAVEVAALDPAPRPQVAIEFAAIKKVLDERHARISALETRMAQLQSVVEDPAPTPQTEVELSALKAAMDDRGERMTRLEEQMNALTRTLLEGTVITRDTRPAPKRR